MSGDSENASVVTFIDNYSNRNDDNNATTPWEKTSVTALTHPCTGQEQHFILSEKNIYEMQSIARNYGSFFIGSRVISNGALHVMTRVDPLYFVLRELESQKEKHTWQPLDQLEVSPVVQECIADPQQWKHVCAVKKLGDDLVLYKFQPERALEWLVQKQQATLEVVKQQLLQSKRSQRRATQVLMSQGGGAFSNSFRLAQDEDNVLDVEEQPNDESTNDGGGNNNNNTSKTTTSSNDKIQLTTMELAAAKEASVEIVGEYVSSEWQTKLRERLHMTTTTSPAVDSKTSNNNDTKEGDGNKKRRASWEANPGQEDADQLLQFTMGHGGSCSKDEESANKKEPNKTAGLKRLAKVNTKGMKSLSSFFGAKKKKTTT